MIDLFFESVDHEDPTAAITSRIERLCDGMQRPRVAEVRMLDAPGEKISVPVRRGTTVGAPYDGTSGLAVIRI